MRVEEYLGAKSSKRFKYIINDEQIVDGMAGEFLCKLLNIEWAEFINEYKCALYADKPNFQDKIYTKYQEFDDDVKKVIGDILPATSPGLKYIERIGEILGVIANKINKGTASYDFYYFVLTNFYDYRQPLFPIQKYNISFLSFICPLIEEYCPFQKYFIEYNTVISEIENVDNVISLENSLLSLRDLLNKEASERKDGLYKLRYNTHAKKISGLIEWYCLTCVDGNGTYLYMYDIEDLMDEEKSTHIDKEELDRLNLRTNFSLLQHLCEEEDAPYKSFFIDLLFSYNDRKKNKIPKNVYYLNDVSDLICHAVLYCFKDNTLPIMQCKYCKKYFPREQNSQEVCSECKGLTGPMKLVEIKKIFGINLFGVINNVYRRLCYMGTGKDSKFSCNRYKDIIGSAHQSELLVNGLKALKNELNNDVYSICERYKSYSDDSMKEEYAIYVSEWITRVNEYYSFALVKKLLEEALLKEPSKPVVIIKKIQLNIITIEEQDYEIKLYE